MAWPLLALYARMVRRIGIVTALGLLLAGVAGCGPAADLKLGSLDCGNPNLFLQTAKGTVSNISAQPLRNVVAEVIFRYGNAGNGPATAPATVPVRIYGSELGPGKTTRFEARTLGNRGFSKCAVVFTDGAGRPIPHVSS